MAKNNQPKAPAGAVSAVSGTEDAQVGAEKFTADESGPRPAPLAGGGPDVAGAPTEQSEPSSAPASEPVMVRARVLAFCGLGAPNDVIEIAEEVAATMPGVIDITPEAVAYALSVSE